MKRQRTFTAIVAAAILPARAALAFLRVASRRPHAGVQVWEPIATLSYPVRRSTETLGAAGL